MDHIFGCMGGNRYVEGCWGFPHLEIKKVSRALVFGVRCVVRRSFYDVSNRYCKGLTACAADPYYTNHVHKIGVKSIQDEAKSGPWAVPETLPKKSHKSLQKSSKRLQKSTKRLPKMTPKTCLKSKKTVWVPLFPHQKDDDNLEAAFSRFLAPAVGPDLAKSSQNAVRVCKNEGPTFSPKIRIISRNVPKMTSLRILKTSPNRKKTRKKPFQKQPEKRHRKNHWK